MQAPSRATPAALVDLTDFKPGARVVGVVNQSDAYVMADWR